MPHPELHSAMKEKHDFGQPESAGRLPDLSPAVPNHECLELLWEDGRVVIRGMSNNTTTFPTSSGKAQAQAQAQAQEKEVGHTVTATKAGRYRATNSVGHGFLTTAPSGQTREYYQDDEMVPWPSYPIEDYYLEFLSDISGVDLNSLSPTVPADRITPYGQAESDTHGLENASISRAPAGCSEPYRMRKSQFFQFQQQQQAFIPSSRPKESDLTMGAVDQSHNGDIPIKVQAEQDLTCSKLMQTSSKAPPSMNFLHFSRPVALVRSNLQFVDRMSSSEKACTPASSNPTESKLIESVNGLSVPAFHGQMTSVTPKADPKPSAKPTQERVPLLHSKPICPEDATLKSGNHNGINTPTDLRLPGNMMCHGSSFTGKHGMEKPPEPVTASPSMCSANRPGASSNDVKNREKRKSLEGEDSDYESEELEDDSVCIRKPATERGMRIKRSRATGVHNLSERRQRERINEKMRALQKLIPNCTKVDKALMLDEAIEYLKTLQKQVQMMSMCSGLHMMPMMLPLRMQHIHPSQVGPFAPFGVSMGMGMGLGFGMGMLEMTGSSMIPVPHMHRPPYPWGFIPGSAELHKIPGSNNLQTIRIPGQAPSMSMPYPALLTTSMKVNPAPDMPGPEVSSEQATNSAPPNSKNQNLQTFKSVVETSANRPRVEISTQANKECSEQSLQIGNQSPNIDGNETIRKETGISSTL